MAVKAVHVSDVPHHNLTHDQQQQEQQQILPENANQLSFCSPCGFSYINNQEGEESRKLIVMGHRGSGMNMLQSPDRRMKLIKENTLLSFNTAAKLPLDFIEFDVQVTKGDYPVIFHDNFILTQHRGVLVETRVTDLTLQEFLSYGPQKMESINGVGKPLFRKTKDGRVFEWKVEQDDCLCTLEEAFNKVEIPIGFNIELKFDDQLVYTTQQLTHSLDAILKVVYKHAGDRRIIFSSFQPDAAQLMRKLQKKYPVFFLTNGGSEIYADVRRNSLEEAINVCKEGGLQGIVSEVKAIFRNPAAIARIKESKLSLVTYGQLNNIGEVLKA